MVTAKAMTVKGKALLEALVTALEQHGHGEHDYCKEEVPKEWKGYPLLWSGYGLDRGECVRDGGVFGDMSELESEICDMFGYYFRTIRDVALKEIGSDASFNFVVEPSWVDHTYYVMSDDDTIIIKGSHKAWNFGADSPEELAELMEDDYNSIKCNITSALIRKGSASTAKKGEVVSGNGITVVSIYFDDIIVRVGESDKYRLDKGSLLRCLQKQNFTVEKKRVRKYLHIV